MGVTDSGTWAVVVSGTNKWIGKVVGRVYAEDMMLNGRPMWLDHALDFFSPILPMRDREGNLRGVQRDPICMPLDFTTQPTKVYVRADTIYFFEDMQEADRNVYKRFVDMAIDQMVNARAERAGIVLGDVDARQAQEPRRIT